MYLTSGRAMFNRPACTETWMSCRWVSALWPTANTWSVQSSILSPNALFSFYITLQKIVGTLQRAEHIIYCNNNTKDQQNHSSETHTMNRVQSCFPSGQAGNSEVCSELINRRIKAVHEYCVLWECRIWRQTQPWEVTEVIGSRLSIWPDPNNTRHRL